ncbi:MAG: hypothetical protein F6K30_10715 [Cyanothece sp. SIO2G6]|nr:hypothetical protein [Cyanothece sp. SIO2G6]
MKQVYLHIGLHKTGTTYMQKVFTDNREKLRSLGVDYPELGAEYLLGHHNLAWSFIPNKPLINGENFSCDRFFEYIESCECSKILISSEDFDFLQLAQIEKLRQRLAHFEVRIVVYIRQPLNALYSYWQEAVKHGDTTPFNDYCFQVLDQPTSLNYGQVLDRWSAKFGIDVLSIVVYDNLLEDNEDIALYCLQQVLAIDISVHDVELPQSRINVATDIRQIELIRQLNAIYKAENNTKTIPPVFWERLRQYFEKEGMEFTKKLDEFFSYETMDSPQYQPLYQHFQQVQEGVIGRYGDRVFNMMAENILFTEPSVQNYKIPLIDSDAIREVLDLEEVDYTKKIYL